MLSLAVSLPPPTNVLQVHDVDVEEEKMALEKTDYVPLTWRLVPEIGTTEDIGAFCFGAHFFLRRT